MAGLVRANDAVIAGIAGRCFTDDAEAATSDDCAGDKGARAGEHSAAREIACSAAPCGDPIERRRWNDPPKVLGAAKPTSSVRMRRMLGAPWRHHGAGRQ